MSCMLFRRWRIVLSYILQIHFSCCFFLQYNSYMLSTIHQSMQNPSGHTSQHPGSADDLTSSPSHLIGGVRNVECPQPAFPSVRPSSLLCAGRSVPPVDFRHGGGGGTYDEGTLEFLSAEMNFSALYMHDIHNWRIAHTTHVDDGEHARQLWQTDSPTALDIVPVTHRMPNIQEGSEDEQPSAAAGRETDYLLTTGSGITQQVWYVWSLEWIIFVASFIVSYNANINDTQLRLGMWVFISLLFQRLPEELCKFVVSVPCVLVL